MILLIVCAPMAILGALELRFSPSDWIYGVTILASVAAVIGYNLTVRLMIDATDVTLKRYGRTVWSVPRRGTSVEDGLAGELPFIPALVLWRDGRKAGYVLKLWFDEKALTTLRTAVGT